MKTFKPKYGTSGWFGVALMFITKTLLFVNYKFTFPFEPFLASQLNLTWSRISMVVMLPDICGTLNIFLAHIWAKADESVLCCSCTLLVGVTTILVPFTTSFWQIMVLRTIFGFTYMIGLACVTTTTGKLSDESQRAKYIAIVEFSWTFADVIMPMLGWGLKLPHGDILVWGFLGGVTVLFTGVLWVHLPRSIGPDKLHHPSESTHLLTPGQPPEVAPWGCGGFTDSQWRLWVVIFFGFVVTITIIPSRVNYGWWLERDAGFDSVSVGVTMFYVSVGETVGVVVCTYFADNIGLKKSCVLATLTSGGIALLWFFTVGSNTIKTDLLLLSLASLFSECTYITIASFATVISPRDSFVPLTYLFGFCSFGGFLGVTFGPKLWFELNENYIPYATSLLVYAVGWILGGALLCTA